MSLHFFFTGVFARIFWNFVLVALIPLPFALLVIWHLFSTSVEEHINEKLIAISNGKSALLQNKMNNLSAFITNIANNTTLVSSIDRIKEDQNKNYQHSAQQFQELFAKQLDIYPDFHDLLFISSEGRIIFSLLNEKYFGADINRELKDTALSSLFNDVKIHLNTMVSEFTYYPPSGALALFIATPIFSKGIWIGELVAQIRPEMLYEFTRHIIGLPHSGEIIFGKQKGDEIIVTTPTTIGAKNTLGISFKVGTNIGIPLQRAARGEVGIGLSTDHRGKRVLARWQYIPQLNWGMVVKVDADKIFAPTQMMRTVTILICLFLFIAIAMVALIVSKTILNPLLDLRKKSLLIGKGELQHVVNSPLNDEIGDLARAFETMRLNLQESHDDLEQKINLRTAALRRSNKELEQFAYVTSHDLQEPLRAITNYIELIEEELKGKINNEETSKHFSYVKAGSNRMRTLIEDLLKYSRISTQHRPVSKVNLGDIITKSKEDLEFIITEKHAVIECDQMPEIFCEAPRMQQLFTNLLSNSLKFTVPLTIPKIEIHYREVSDGHQIIFSDNGIGFDNKYREIIFKIFKRLHGRNEYPGTGIGLSLCKKIVEQHGGNISASATPGGGATFTIWIPQYNNSISALEKLGQMIGKSEGEIT
ncbi:MAG: HAMP domain-containing protein [Oligoflexia bacterium]|nr:HAMP domain-containing protein [Oligoflexia bacterium]